MTFRIGVAAIAAVASLVLAACQPSIRADHLTTAEAGQVSQTIRGTVVSTRGVTVRNQDPGVLTGAGAVAGGLGGSMIGGGGTERALAAVGGALLGGAVGYGAEQLARNNVAIEYVIRLQDGRVVTIVQDDDVVYPPGSSVLVALGPRARVLPGSAAPASTSPRIEFQPPPGGAYPPPGSPYGGGYGYPSQPPYGYR